MAGCREALDLGYPVMSSFCFDFVKLMKAASGVKGVLSPTIGCQRELEITTKLCKPTHSL